MVDTESDVVRRAGPSSQRNMVWMHRLAVLFAYSIMATVHRTSGSKGSYRQHSRLGKHVLVGRIMFGEAFIYRNVKDLPDETQTFKGNKIIALGPFYMNESRSPTAP